MSYRTTTLYYVPQFNSSYDICGALNGTRNNKIFDLFIDIFEHSIPKGLVHGCPYSGAFIARNISLGFFDLMKQFPAGTYKIKSHLYNKDDDNILTIIHEVIGYYAYQKSTKKSTRKSKNLIS